MWNKEAVKLVVGHRKSHNTVKTNSDLSLDIFRGKDSVICANEENNK